MITRRTFLFATGAAVLPQPRGDGRVSAAIRAPTQQIAPGEHALGLGEARDGLLIVPKSYKPGTPAPLAVMLHGAGGRARRVASLFAAAHDFGVIMLVPESRGATWDAIRGRFGPDVDFIAAALTHTIDRCTIDRRRVAIGGFSDGATYALSVGLASGDLFTHILACSPGFIVPGPTRGRPRVYMSHGNADEILAIEQTSRRIYPALREAGYTVKYHEFDGPHAVPLEIAREAFDWFVRG